MLMPAREKPAHLVAARSGGAVGTGKMRRLLALGCLAAIGCAAPERHLRLDLPRTEIAEVRGLDGSSGSFGLPPPKCHIAFQAIDGQSLEGRFEDGLPRVIDLRPGYHVLRCWYQVMPVSGPTKEGTSDVAISAQAGHVYQMKLNWGPVTVATGDTFTVELRDITEELERMEQERVRARDEEIARQKEARSRPDP
jgi:hypothetical protein